MNWSRATDDRAVVLPNAHDLAVADHEGLTRGALVLALARGYSCGADEWLGSVDTPLGLGSILPAAKLDAFKNMAFEQTLKTAVRNASNNAVADFSGTSERIIVNNFVKQGTGLGGLVLELLLGVR